MNIEQRKIMLSIARIIIDTVAETGTAPASAIYLALQTKGATLGQYTSIMTTLVDAGYLTYAYDAYQATGKKL